MNAAIERMIVEGMVIKRKRERALFELSHPQKRGPEDAYPLLKERGAPEDCYILSLYKDMDGTFVPLRQAMTWEGILYADFISCIPGQLAYWHGEEGDHYLLYSD